MSEVLTKAQNAKKSAAAMARLDSQTRDKALHAMADILELHAGDVIAANNMDMTAAIEADTPAPLLDRLMLNEERVKGIANALRALANETDPIGEVVSGHRMPNGIDLKQVRVPLGVVAMIYEARPNVTADAAGLCVKTGNACILRGGSMAINSTITITNLLYEAALASGLPAHCIQAIHTTDRKATDELMSLHGLIDVLIPRGGAGLIKNCVENSKVPVIETGVGNCHVYIHEDAQPDMARDIVMNGKCQRPGVCNAIETVLIDASIAADVLPMILRDLDEQGVKLHLDRLTGDIAQARGIAFEPATQEDWATEYLDLELAVRAVSGVEEAILHINTYGTHHSEAIISENYTAVERFLNEVDAAAVYANASTRFTDGGEFGLGAEIGISTQKLHTRGPMGLTALTSTKFILTGTGQVR